MKKSKLTLIIDGNWLMMSRLSVLHGRYADGKTLMKELKLLIIKSINVTLRTFPLIDNIVFVSDGGSWRKEIALPEYLKKSKTTYKGNRVQTDEYDWDMIFHEYNNFVEELQKNGISAFSEPNIEGDDWCWYWSTTLNKQGVNVIIWTKDRDITQLVSNDNNGCFTVVWNKDNGVFLKETEDLTNYLLNPLYQHNAAMLDDIVNRSVKKNLVSPEHVQIDKIIRGDKGDNIMPIITKRSKNGGDKLFRVTEKHLPEHLDIYNMKDVGRWINEMLNSKSYAGKVVEPYTQILDHFEYNRKMVVLAESSYPDDVLKTLHKYDDWFSSHQICADVNTVEATLLAQKNELSSILDEI